MTFKKQKAERRTKRQEALKKAREELIVHRIVREFNLSEKDYYILGNGNKDLKDRAAEETLFSVLVVNPSDYLMIQYHAERMDANDSLVTAKRILGEKKIGSVKATKIISPFSNAGGIFLVSSNELSNFKLISDVKLGSFKPKEIEVYSAIMELVGFKDFDNALTSANILAYLVASDVFYKYISKELTFSFLTKLLTVNKVGDVEELFCEPTYLIESIQNVMKTRHDLTPEKEKLLKCLYSDCMVIETNLAFSGSGLNVTSANLKKEDISFTPFTFDSVIPDKDLVQSYDKDILNLLEGQE